ncbi:MAG TPA: extracellular solute-binding protein [Bacilli bacterium]|nr:extracellular solute-binding protein [Bacilli bacterium]
MKKVMLIFFLNATLLSVTSFKEESLKVRARDDNTLYIFNWEDYIAEEEEDGDVDVLEAFTDYYFEEYGEEITIVYDTFSTNEDMYNIVKLNGAKYDLIAPSDYMIQRMLNEDMLEEFSYRDNRYTNMPNYSDYVSPYHFDLFRRNAWEKYAVGYMWGTFGLLFNTETNEEIKDDMRYWDILWDEKYFKKIAIKDSMREAYLVGLFKVHHDELVRLRGEYDAGTLDAETYNAIINDLLNDTSLETIKAVEEELKLLKSNIYGLEVDQGKNDIVLGTIAINTAWSGDAVYSIYHAAEEVGEDVLRYVIPEEGSNIWFDAWVMPKGANKTVAERFINFLSMPEIAIANMEYIGYTSFIAGEEVLAYIYDFDEVLEDEEGYDIDLRYFFGDTINELDDAVVTISEDYIGGMLATQYPTLEEVRRSIVMRDFGIQNNLVIDMWANFKATEIKLWMVIFSLIVVLAVLTLLSYQLYLNFLAKKRKERWDKA